MKQTGKVVTKADVPIIVNVNIGRIKSNNSNIISINAPQNKYIRAKTRKRKLSHLKSIHIKTNRFSQDVSVIEEKLPNPYTITDYSKKPKIVEFNIKSKYKSLYADYLNHTSTFDATKKDTKLKLNTSIKNYPSKIESHIYFTKITHSYSFDLTQKTKTNSRIIKNNI